ncbi:uncharacterized protein L3040_006166 [Drepanopeziza brunnea f. sp. 'multigermtubi']|uniref:uncharacterized protein n=2 Tax=Drepanopeziza brunnea f. sp. 'multigermtubi' TaxID=698441 RepID=UPI0023A05D5F|nr:hypothetical protein L3040_006166 [Drepanopeziza brunnea f. sp. 'multigermtubi']
MFPHQDHSGQSGGSLEDRLRGLILSNAETSSVPRGGHNLPSLPPPPGFSPQPVLDLNSDISGQHQQQFTHSAPLPITSNAPNSLPPPGLSSSPGRKRLNQAQRRQMNAQLSIPIDSRPIPGVQAGRGNGFYSPNPQFGNQNFNNSTPTYQNQRFPQQPQQSQHQQQQLSPRFQNQGPGPASPYSPRPMHPQNPLQSPMNQYRSGPNPQLQQRQGPGQYQQPPPTSCGRPPVQNRQLYQPGSQNSHGGRPFAPNTHDLASQTSHLERLVNLCVPQVGIDRQEETEKEAFRALVELACREAIAEYETKELGNEKFDPSTVELQCFGSMRSGFATKASDMDLALLTPNSHPPADSPESLIPRILEKRLLDLGYGTRLLTRTRVPIIKLCEKPTEKLLSDLLQERHKWESGFVSDHEEEDEHHDVKPTPAVDDARQDLDTQPIPSPRNDHQKAKLESYDESLATLKQKEEQSLGDYCNSAKRLLRKLGGRDVTMNSPDLNEKESTILNDVCKAFISGLYSQELFNRLCHYQSILPLYDSSLPFVQRSLHGVWTQADGERLVLAWHTRPLLEPNEKLEYEGSQLVEAWCALQDRTALLCDPAFYSRQLYLASEKLKKINSIQLVVLEQIQHEDPMYYQARAQKILNELTSPGQPLLVSKTTSIVVDRYIEGIANAQIRESIRSADRGEATLHQVGLHHRALQLAIDYEHALKVGAYKDSDRPDVEQYVELLRSRNFYGSVDPEIDVDQATLVKKMRILPDPTVTSLNKPRDRFKDHLEFPKADIGIQCDINFSAQLAIHNTQLLRCYSQSDPRVKVMVLFVKHWAKTRGINTPYRGTLSSYGYVLMVLHYLVNVAKPFVCINLQEVHKDPPAYLPPAEIDAHTNCLGRDVRFWRNETEIKNLADRKLLNNNLEPIGPLLRGFFEYYAQPGQMSSVDNRGFDWGREVLSLRTSGGILTKQEKGWIGAKTVIQKTTIAAPPTPSSATIPDTANSPEGPLAVEAPKTPKLPLKTMEETKEIRHRYLFAIEDPFELDHNVARTVTHNGIVSIRDEFRRAWRIIKSFGKPYEGQEGQLLDPVSTTNDEKSGALALMDLIHGPAPKTQSELAA